MKYQMLLGLTGLAAVQAHPKVPREANPNTHVAKRGVDISKYSLPSSLSSYSSASSVRSSNIQAAGSSKDYVEVAKDLVKEKFPDQKFRAVKDNYVSSNGVGHVYFKQQVHDLDVDNADLVVNVLDGKVFSFGGSAFTGKTPKESPLTKRDFSSPVSALKGAVKTLGLDVEVDNAKAQANFGADSSEIYKIEGVKGTERDVEARLVYIQKGKDEPLKLTWRVETDTLDNWLLTYVDASSTEEVVGAVDYVHDASYQVYPWPIPHPPAGERELVVDPERLESSPFGWHSDGSENYTTTWGNTGIAQENRANREDSEFEKNHRPESEDLVFEYPYSLNETDYSKYEDASITQLFYTAQKFNDLAYMLGWNEEAGNYQVNNNGKGGKEGDYVLYNAQDGSGKNNANFAVGPDGMHGRIRMYMWDETTPERDCSFDAGVVIHEFVHGLSTRLTGGPDNAGCLSGADESGGMGEGWSDFYATTIRLLPEDDRDTVYAMGNWLTGDEAGIREYRYSTDMDENPLTYKDLGRVEGIVHAIGTVWCTILYEFLWNMIDKHGKNDDDFPEVDEDGVPDDGKYLALKIVQEGMALQPCSPDFIAARDAIIDADEALTGGDNFCEIWKAFSKRGAGPDAVQAGYKEDFELPADCSE